MSTLASAPRSQQATRAQSATTSRVARSTMVQGALTLGAAGLSVVVLHLSTRYLGPATYGQVVAATALVTVLSAFADGGLATIGAREMVRRPADAASILATTCVLRALIGVALVPCTLGIAVVFYRSTPFTISAALLLSPALALGAIQSAVGATFVAAGRNQLNAAINAASLVAVLVGVKIVSDHDLGPTAYMLVLLGGYLVSTVGTLFAAVHHLSQCSRPSFQQARILVTSSAPLGLVLILNVLYLRLDSLLLALMRSSTTVGLYGVAYRVIELIMALPSLFMIALLPEIAAASPARLRALLNRALQISATVGIPVAVSVAVTAPAVLNALGGAAYVPAAAALRILAVGAGASYLSAVFGNALIVMGHQRRLLPVTVAVVASNLVLNAVLIPALGMNGAALAMTGSEVLALVLVWRLFVRFAGFRPNPTSLRWPVLAGAAALAAGEVVSGLPEVSRIGFAALTLPVIAALGAYLVLLAPSGGLRPFAGILPSRAQGLWRR